MSLLPVDAAPLKIFVYGTLQPGERYHEEFCRGALLAVFPAKVRGRLFDLPALGYPALAAGNDWVPGYLLELKPDEDLLVRLDELEGVDESSPEDCEYQRVTIEAYSSDDEVLGIAWVYIMAPSRIAAFGGVLMPSGKRWREGEMYQKG